MPCRHMSTLWPFTYTFQRTSCGTGGVELVAWDTFWGLYNFWPLSAWCSASMIIESRYFLKTTRGPIWVIHEHSLSILIARQLPVTPMIRRHIWLGKNMIGHAVYVIVSNLYYEPVLSISLSTLVRSLSTIRYEMMQSPKWLLSSTPPPKFFNLLERAIAGAWQLWVQFILFLYIFNEELVCLSQLCRSKLLNSSSFFYKCFFLLSSSWNQTGWSLTTICKTKLHVL